MPEHFHLLITEPELSDPSVVMKVIKERFSRQVNQSRVINQSSAVKKKHAGAGAPLIAHFAMSGCSRPDRTPLWQKRFYDFNVRTEQKQIEKLRYMHRNPVKRGLVETPEQWEWSSFRSYRYGETGLVRVKFQEWPIEIKSRPVVTFGEASAASLSPVRSSPHPQLVGVRRKVIFRKVRGCEGAPLIASFAMSGCSRRNRTPRWQSHY